MKVTTLIQLQEVLQTLPAKYRSAPFWGFNGKMEKENMEFQMEEMKKQGMGGFFIHSREGLETPYLSEEWMDAVRVCVEKAKEQELELWIYDEDKWPSGCAGGMVSRENPKEYTAKGLTLEILSEQEAIEKDLTVGKERADGTIVGVYNVSLNSEESKIFVLRMECSKNSEWYNGFAPTDNLNPEAVRCFINMTHEKYKACLGEDFGGVIKGFFTDEPNYYDFYSSFTEGRPWLPWTKNFVEIFEKKRGYNPLPKLPLLFYDGDGSTKTRHDYWHTLTELFSESYMKQIYEWCEANYVDTTGHMLYENDLGYNVRVCGAAMPHYRYLHHPGIDILGEQTKEYLTVKQCTSVANQYGRDGVITETYGCTGWQFDFEGQKWLGDWQFVMGVGRRCQHLMQYSIAGCRKRDYPPVFNYQTTWWEYNYLMEDYFARLSACTAVGDVVRPILVIHPISSLWTQCRSDLKENLNNIEMNMGWLDTQFTSLNEWGEEYNRLAGMLVRNHFDFDFGDEIILSEEGVAKDGKLRINKAEYEIVIVPRVLSLFSSTMELLKQFSEQGGKIYWVGSLPEMIEGEQSLHLPDQISEMRVACIDDYETLIQTLIYEQRQNLSVCSQNGGEDTDVLTMLRKTDDGYMLFVVNNDREHAHPVKIRLPFVGSITAYDPWKNRTSSKPAYVKHNLGKAVADKMEFIECLEPAGSMVFFVDKTKTVETTDTIEYPYVHPHYTEPVYASLGPEAAFTRTMPNVLTLDRCQYRLNNSDSQIFSDEMEVWQAQKQIREKLGMQQIYYNGAPQRYSWIYDTENAKEEEFELLFTFWVDQIPKGECYLAIEKAEEFGIYLNGEKCIFTEEYFMDKDICMVQLRGIKEGENRLVVNGCYKLSVELEDIYFVGNFGVNMHRHIVAEPKKLHFGDWCLQGYYHYPGNMIYHFELPDYEQEMQEITLSLPAVKGTLSKVSVNGETAGYLMGKTCTKLCISSYLKETDNKLDIEVVGSPRNMFGPFHQSYTGCSRISWADFRTEGLFRTDAYVLEPYGIMGQIVLTKEL